MEESEIIDRLSKHPETYKSLLGNKYGRNTITVIVRKKILRNVKNGEICRMSLSGTRGSGVIFYSINKKHNIIIVSEHRDFKYYICLEMEKINNTTVELKNTEELIGDKWLEVGDVSVFIGNIIKVI